MHSASSICSLTWVSMRDFAGMSRIINCMLKPQVSTKSNPYGQVNTRWGDRGSRLNRRRLRSIEESGWWECLKLSRRFGLEGGGLGLVYRACCGAYELRSNKIFCEAKGGICRLKKRILPGRLSAWDGSEIPAETDSIIALSWIISSRVI
jgi:hypothetical protein